MPRLNKIAHPVDLVPSPVDNQPGISIVHASLLLGPPVLAAQGDQGPAAHVPEDTRVDATSPSSVGRRSRGDPVVQVPKKLV